MGMPDGTKAQTPVQTNKAIKEMKIQGKYLGEIEEFITVCILIYFDYFITKKFLETIKNM